MVFNGKTLEDALASAEKATGKSRNELIYKVEEKKSGLFKLSSFEVEITGFKKHGTLAIKNGKVVYNEGDIPPAIIPGDNLIIKVNGEIISKKTRIYKTDVIDIEVMDTQSEKSINLEVLENGMEAYLTTLYLPERKYEIVDCDFKEEIKVEARMIAENFPDPYSKGEVENIINENKIKFGVKWENINSILKGGRYQIARGQEPQEPVDDSIEFFFETKDEKKPVEIDGKVDYYNINKIESVEKGKLLALRREGKDGKHGYNVYSRIIAPRNRNKYKLKKGPGCQVLDNGNRVVADIDGLVSLKEDAICVFPVYTVNSDVDIKTGNIEFEGDILVKGNVLEGLKIAAANNINIYGSAAGAVIISGGNTKIEKNVIKSILKSGEKQINDSEAFNYIKKSNEFVIKILEMHSKLVKIGNLPQNLSDGQLFKVLMESKLKKYKDSILEGNNFIMKNKVREDILELWHDVIKIYEYIEGCSSCCVEKANCLKIKLEDFIEKFEAISTPADIIVNYCQNSEVYASNNVEVKGKGCYNTIIKAENKVIFSGYPGVMRGGEVYGANGIEAKEVGSNAGVMTLLRTSKNGVIQADIVYQNTTIRIEEQSYVIDNPVKMLKAYMDKGELVVEKLKL